MGSYTCGSPVFPSDVTVGGGGHPHPHICPAPPELSLQDRLSSQPRPKPKLAAPHCGNLLILTISHLGPPYPGGDGGGSQWLLSTSCLAQGSLGAEEGVKITCTASLHTLDLTTLSRNFLGLPTWPPLTDSLSSCHHQKPCMAELSSTPWSPSPACGCPQHWPLCIGS